MPDGPSFLESHRSASFPTGLPPKLRDLGPRQREIAAIVYESTAATPRDVQAQLSDPRSVRVVRTLLDRMVAKGLVNRRRNGRHNEVIYLAAIPTPHVKEAALRRVIDEHFGGSLNAVAEAITVLAEKVHHVPTNLADLRRMVNAGGELAR